MRTRAMGAVTVLTLVLGISVATANGGQPQGTMTLSPDSGPGGTEFTVNGTGCFADEVRGSVGGVPVSGWSAVPEEDGTWSKDLAIPEFIGNDVHGNPIPAEPGEYPVFARCVLDEVAPG